MTFQAAMDAQAEVDPNFLDGALFSSDLFQWSVVPLCLVYGVPYGEFQGSRYDQCS